MIATLRRGGFGRCFSIPLKKVTRVCNVKKNEHDDLCRDDDVAIAHLFRFNTNQGTPPSTQ